jgi:hypothetical protein
VTHKAFTGWMREEEDKETDGKRAKMMLRKGRVLTASTAPRQCRKPLVEAVYGAEAVVAARGGKGGQRGKEGQAEEEEQEKEVFALFVSWSVPTPSKALQGVRVTCTLQVRAAAVGEGDGSPGGSKGDWATLHKGEGTSWRLFPPLEGEKEEEEEEEEENVEGNGGEEAGDVGAGLRGQWAWVKARVHRALWFRARGSSEYGHGQWSEAGEVAVEEGRLERERERMEDKRLCMERQKARAREESRRAERLRKEEVERKQIAARARRAVREAKEES